MNEPQIPGPVARRGGGPDGPRRPRGKLNAPPADSDVFADVDGGRACEEIVTFQQEVSV